MHRGGKTPQTPRHSAYAAANRAEKATIRVRPRAASDRARAHPTAARRAGSLLMASSLALLLIDVVNPLDFEGADRLLPQALDAARGIAALKTRARAAGIPTIYVNDNYGRWDLGFRELCADVRARRTRGLRLLELVEPDFAEDLFVLKPMHSGFYGTALDILLGHLDTRSLILTGIQGNMCVFATASDAHMRRYRVMVPADCTASEHPEENDLALRQMARAFKADTRTSCDIELDRHESCFKSRP
jgi:nicotinamidase-related amidase